jgi:hypothetical protein
MLKFGKDLKDFSGKMVEKLISMFFEYVSSSTGDENMDDLTSLTSASCMDTIVAVVHVRAQCFPLAYSTYYYVCLIMFIFVCAVGEEFTATFGRIGVVGGSIVAQVQSMKIPF